MTVWLTSALLGDVILYSISGHPVTVSQYQRLQLVGPGGDGQEYSTGQVVTLTQLQWAEVRVVVEHRSEEVISEELETCEVESSEVVSIVSEDVVGWHGDSLVVAQVQVLVDADEDRDQTVEDTADTPHTEQVTRRQVTEYERIQDIMGRQQLQHLPLLIHYITMLFWNNIMINNKFNKNKI